MEFLLHYVWQHRLYGLKPLKADDGRAIEVLDTGVHNLQESGPDFFNAKIKLDGIVWAGNVEIHERSSDWYRHHHEKDDAYNNVVLHVVSKIDREAVTHNGKRLPQLQLAVPDHLTENYRELLAEETYPPCYRVIPKIEPLFVHAWLNRLTVERLEEKTERIKKYLQRTGGDWERAFFITLARAFGFGTNAFAFEQWALNIDLGAVGRHRDDLFQVEAFFFGQAGLLSEELVKPVRRDDYFVRLQSEYAFLRNKFNLQPLHYALWKFGKLRPQNFPYVRLSQLASLFYDQKITFSHLLKTKDLKAFRELLRASVTPYWRTHYAFGEESGEKEKTLQAASLNLLIINAASPTLFAYARQTSNEELAERAFDLLEQLPAERNYITRCWERAGIRVSHAADSQALIQLRKQYCDRKDCLRCRFGAEYLRMPRVAKAKV